MSRAFDRTLKSVKQQLMPKREPRPDFTGWKDTDIVMWRFEHGESLQDMVREGQKEWEKHLKKMEAKRTRDRLREESAERMDAILAAAETKPEPTPEPETPLSGQPKPEPQWWEEKARWRQRGPDDYDWDERKPRPGMCLVEYDPLEWDNGDDQDNEH